MAGTTDKTMVEEILEIAMQYGIPAILEAIKGWNKTEITQADIDSLPAMIKRPEDY